MFHEHISPDIASGLKEIRRRIAKANIPSSKLDENITIAGISGNSVKKQGKKLLCIILPKY